MTFRQLYHQSSGFRIFFYSMVFCLCGGAFSQCHTDSKSVDAEAEKKKIAARLDTLNSTAAAANFNGYFNCYTEDGVFTGTDATERWEKKAFMEWAKPFFDRGRAWSFKSVERHIYLDADGKMAWFDELLQTQMKICRGSGVLKKEGDDWKIAQYILSATIPNPLMDSVVVLKTPVEDSLLKTIGQH